MLTVDVRDTDATLALYQLSDYLYRYYGKKVIILLDEYDTPMQEAYVGGFWDEIVALPGACLMLLSRQIRGWSGGL